MRFCLAWKRSATLGLFCWLLVSTGSPCAAGLLNLSSSLKLDPWADVTMSFGKAMYDATTKNLSILGTATAIDYDHVAPPDASVLSGGAGNPASFAIQIQVDNDGTLIGGSAGNDLQIKGRITGGPHPSPVYGTLLTGEIAAFGFADASPFRILEFVFDVTGGSQAPQFGTKIGVIFDSIHGFGGSFIDCFSTSGSGNSDVVALPEPASWGLSVLGVLLLGAWRYRCHFRR